MNDLTHLQARTWIEQAPTGLLDAAQKAALARHLDACPDCRQYLAETQSEDSALHRALSDAYARPEISPADLRALAARARLVGRRRAILDRTAQALQFVSWTAVLAAAVLGINWLFANFARPTPEPAAPVPTILAQTSPAPATETAEAAASTSPPGAASPQLLLTLSGSGRPVHSVAFAPDGAMVAAACADGTVRVWRTQDGTLLNTIQAHAQEATAVAFTPDGTLLITGGKDGSVNVWLARSGAFLRTLLSETASVLSIRVSPNGELLAITLSNYSVVLIRISDGKSLDTYQSAIRLDVNQSSDRNSTLIAGAESAIWLNSESETPFNLSIQGQNGKALDVTLSNAGNTLASSSTDGLIYIWKIFDLTVTGEDPRTHLESVTRTITGILMYTMEGHVGAVNSLDFSTDGAYLASGADDGSAILWSIADGAPAEVLTGHTGPVTSVEFSPDDQLLATSSADGTVRIWSTTDY